eukprot:TRINITY_DN62014_c0_g1_i1.p1 TRINITY_DN62014_c0_g1~~TRINITY_DN62014_c0_g1_i1.p1  ORF type:complete len:394 (+),score=60.27 TRINITY_DN62014_c0_g1_i1:186-1367(+)
MGSLLSLDEENDSDLTEAAARERLAQRQRAQVLLLTQLREQTAAGAGEELFGLQPTRQPIIRQTQVLKNPLHVRGKSVQLSCATSPDGEQQWQLSFIFDAMLSCEVIVHVGLGCSIEVRSPLVPEGDLAESEVVVAWSPPGQGGCGASRWVSLPAFFREGLNQEFRGEIDLGNFAQKSRKASKCGTPRGQHETDKLSAGVCAGASLESCGPRMQTQGFCIELKAASRPEETQQKQSSQAGTNLARSSGGVAAAAEWTTGRFVRRDCSQGNIHQMLDEMANTPEVVEAKIVSQSVRLPGPGLAPCYSMHEVYGADSTEPGSTEVLGHDCVICMSDGRDTAMLPCRHMCLCSDCAETMRSRVQYRSYRCPICRERVSSFLQIRQDAFSDNLEGMV